MSLHDHTPARDEDVLTLRPQIVEPGGRGSLPRLRLRLRLPDVAFHH